MSKNQEEELNVYKPDQFQLQHSAVLFKSGFDKNFKTNNPV